MPTKRGIYDVTEFKALDEGDNRGKFEAVVAVFGNVDLVGDRVVQGAFSKSLDKWKATADPIPIIWSHDWGNPSAHIGAADPADVEETPSGLKVRGSLDLDNPFAAQVYRLMKERRVKEMSFAYNVTRERAAKDGANELIELDLIEAGPTLKGANPSTELLAVKSSLEVAAAEEKAQEEPEAEESPEEHKTGAKAGRAISKATASTIESVKADLESAAGKLADLLNNKEDEPEEEKAQDEAEAVKDESENGKASDDDLLRLKAEIEAARIY